MGEKRFHKTFVALCLLPHLIQRIKSRMDVTEISTEIIIEIITRLLLRLVPRLLLRLLPRFLPRLLLNAYIYIYMVWQRPTDHKGLIMTHILSSLTYAFCAYRSQTGTISGNPAKLSNGQTFLSIKTKKYCSPFVFSSSCLFSDVRFVFFLLLDPPHPSMMNIGTCTGRTGRRASTVPGAARSCKPR